MSKYSKIAIWMSGIALLLCVVAILITLHNNITGDVSIKEIMEISIATTSIGVTVLLGVQIYTIISIDKKIKESIEEAHAMYKSENEILAMRMKTLSIAIQKFTTGNIYITREEYNEALCVFCLSAIEANKLGEEDLVSLSLEQAISLFNHCKYFHLSDIGRKYMNEIKEEMVKIPDRKAIEIYNFLSGIECSGRHTVNS
jgi:hypothetical protein